MSLSRIEDTAAFMEKYRLLIDAGETLALPVLGNSMSPFIIHKRDTVYLRKPAFPLKRGDIALYRRGNGDFIMHRVCKVENGLYTTVGDAHMVLEPGISDEQIIAVAVSAIRKGREQRPGIFWWDFFAGFWLSILPARHFIMKTYGFFSKVIRR